MTRTRFSWKPMSTCYPYSYGMSVAGALRDVVYGLLVVAVMVWLFGM